MTVSYQTVLKSPVVIPVNVVKSLPSIHSGAVPDKARLKMLNDVSYVCFVLYVKVMGN